MGTKPGERMMGQMEGRTETISGELKSEDYYKHVLDNMLLLHTV